MPGPMSRLQVSRARTRSVLGLILGALLSVACADSSNERGDAAAGPTFRRDVAPIVHENCASCHHPGEAAPFSLLTYEDVRKRAKQIGIVTASRFMPPWLPLPDHGGPFLGDRRLSDEDLATLQAWVAAGAPEGDSTPPVEPEWAQGTGGWQLGEPDLVVRLPRAYTLPAEGRDVYRNFVIPLPVSEPHFVRAVELRPDNRFVLHHAVMRVDRTPSARQLDQRDPAPGFGGMAMGRAEVPDGQFLGWAPGKMAFAGYEDMAWRLNPGDDLVLQMHLRPSGKPETIQPEIGLYFAERPPTRAPVAITLASLDIDIPPGDADHVVQDDYLLPVDVTVLAVYPHAHYIGKDLQAFAELPDGERRWLFRIDPWDFNWQDEYRFAEPPTLPAGSRLVMRTSFDNSADNPFNPNDPPQRIVYGEQSSDEMAELLLQLLPVDPADRIVLMANFSRHNQRGFLDYFRGLVARDRTDVKAHNTLGLAYLSLDRYAEAIGPLSEVVRARPDDVVALDQLARALMFAGQPGEARAHLEHALALVPEDPRTLTGIGIADFLQGRPAEAQAHLERSLELRPGQPQAHAYLGAALASQGQVQAALAELRQALALNPVDLRVLQLLSEALEQAGRNSEADQLRERARRIDPEFVAGG